MGEWECTNCGHIHSGARPPKTCPDCGVGSDKFEFFSDDDDFDDELEDDELDDDDDADGDTADEFEEDEDDDY